MRRLLMFMLMLVVPFAAMAQDAPTPQVEAALVDLNARLGTSLTLEGDSAVDFWTWDEEDFSDASLGCPQPDQMYAQVITRGYIILFTHDGMTYDYRASADGGTVFLCSITEAEATPEADTAQPEMTLTPAGTVIAPENAAQVVELAQVEGNFAAIMEYSPTGNTIAVAGLTIPDPARNSAPAILLYNAHDLSEAPQPLLPNAEPVMSLAYFPTSVGASLVTGGMQGTIAIFPVEPEGFDLLFIEAPTVVESVMDVAISPDGTTIASANNSMMSSVLNEPQGIYLWNASTGEQVSLLDVDAIAMSVAFSPDSTTLAVGDAEGTIHLWDVSSPADAVEIATLTGHNDAISDFAFSPDGAVLATASYDGTARLWNVAGEPEGFAMAAVLNSGTGDPVLTLDFSPDGRLLATAGSLADNDESTHAITLWNAEAAFAAGTLSNADPIAPAATLIGHTGAVASVAFSPDGTRLASAGGDRTLRLWGVDGAG